MLARCGHCLVSSSEEMLRLEAFNLSTVHSLFTSILSVPLTSFQCQILGYSLFLGLSEKMFSVGFEFQAPLLDSCHIRRHLTQCREERTFPQSCLSHFFVPLQELFAGRLFSPTLAEELLVCNAVPLSNCTSCSETPVVLLLAG